MLVFPHRPFQHTPKQHQYPVQASENISLLRTESLALENLSTQLFLETHDLRQEVLRSEKQATLKVRQLR